MGGSGHAAGGGHSLGAPSFFGYFSHFTQAFLLKCSITNSENFVYNQDLPVPNGLPLQTQAGHTCRWNIA